LPASPLFALDRIGDGMAFDPEGAVSTGEC
jgi:hypothetical protein